MSHAPSPPKPLVLASAGFLLPFDGGFAPSDDTCVVCFRFTAGPVIAPVPGVALVQYFVMSNPFPPSGLNIGGKAVCGGDHFVPRQGLHGTTSLVAYTVADATYGDSRFGASPYVRRATFFFC